MTLRDSDKFLVARDGTNYKMSADQLKDYLTVGDEYVNVSGDTMTGTLTVPNLNSTSINGGPLAGFRNAIINGNFDHWQRATSHSTDGLGSADRWANVISGSTATLSRQTFTLGQTDVPGNPYYFMRSTVTSDPGAANYAAISQKIENVVLYSGQTVTVSFWAKANAPRSIAIELAQVFGSGGTPSASVMGIGVTKVSIGTSWQKITATINVPNLTGKVLGTDLNSFLRLIIWFDAGSNYNSRTNSLGQQSGLFDISQVQLEPGSTATPFEIRPYTTELSLCKRYGQWIPYNVLFWSVAAFDNLICPVIWPEMRATPTASGLVANPFITQAQSNNAANNVSWITATGGGLYLQASAGNTTTYVTGYRVWLDAEL